MVTITERLRRLVIPKREVGGLGQPVITPREAQAGARGEIVRSTPVVTGGGGGASSIIPTGRIEDILARRQEEKRFAQEQVRIAEQKSQQSLVRREQRQQQIISGTISGQVQRQGPQPNVIDVPSTEPRGFVQLGFFKAAGASVKRLGTRFRRPGKERAQFTEVLSPFDLTSIPKFAQPSGQIETRGLGGGTILIEPASTGRGFGELGGRQEVTFGEVQKRIDIGRGSQILVAREIEQQKLSKQFSGLQQQVDIGDLGLTQARTKGEELTQVAQERFATTQKDIFGSTPDVPGIRSPRRSGVREAVVIGATLSPLTSFIGAAVSSQQDPLKISSIEDISSGRTSIAGAITQRPGISTTTFLGVGLIRGGLGLKASGRAATKVRVESALQAIEQRPITQFALQRQVGKDIIEIGKFKGVGDEAFGIGEFVSVGKQIGKREVAFGGRIDTTIVAKEFFSGKPIILTEQRLFSGRGVSLPKFGDITPSISKVFSEPLSRGVITGTGKRSKAQFELFTKPPKQPQAELIGGISQRQGDLITGGFGRIKGAPAETITGRGFRSIKDLSIDFPIETKTLTRVITPKQSTGITVLRGGTGKQTPLSTTFAPQVSLPRPIISKGFTPLKGITQPAPTGVTRSLIGIPRAVGGAGLTEQQLARGVGPALPRFDTQFSLRPPSTKQAGGLFVDPTSLRDFTTLGFTQLSFGGLKERTQGRQVAISTPVQKSLQFSLQKPLQLQQLGLETLQQQELTGRQIQSPRGPRSPRFDIGFGFPIIGLPPFPPSLGKSPTGRKRKKGKKVKTKIRPSFSAIITGFEPEAKPISFGGLDLGIVPGQIRGLETGFNIPKKKKKGKKKSVKKKSVKKKSKKKKK